MLPDHDESPTRVPQTPSRVEVPCDVRRQLPRPPLGVGLRFCGVELAAVPVAPAHLDDYAPTGEHNVVSPASVFEDPVIDAVAQPPSMERSAKRELRLRVPAGLSTH